MRTDVPTESEPVGQAEPETLAQAEPQTDVPSEPAYSACTEPSEASNPDDDFQWYDRLVEEEDGWSHDGWPGQTGPEKTGPEEVVRPLAQQQAGLPPDPGPPRGGLPAQIPTAEADRQKSGASRHTTAQEPDRSAPAHPSARGRSAEAA